MKSASFSTRRARKVTSSKFPIGVATTESLPAMRCTLSLLTHGGKNVSFKQGGKDERNAGARHAVALGERLACGRGALRAHRGRAGKLYYRALWQSMRRLSRCGLAASQTKS